MIFRECPRCKSASLSYDGRKEYQCADCGWVFFHNVAAAVGIIIEYEDKILLIVRNKEPQKGKLDVAGGFADPGESLEQAAKREIQEELGITIDKLDYFGSYPNIYEYEGISYNTCDIIFVTRINKLPTSFGTEVKDIILLTPTEMDPNQMAFDSSKRAVSDYFRNKA